MEEERGTFLLLRRHAWPASYPRYLRHLRSRSSFVFRAILDILNLRFGPNVGLSFARIGLLPPIDPLTLGAVINDWFLLRKTLGRGRLARASKLGHPGVLEFLFRNRNFRGGMTNAWTGWI
jgi:hypothetical protein